jgi:membrane associated rhomboid family serine protease
LETLVPNLRRREPIVRIPGIVSALFVVMALAQIAQSAAPVDVATQMLLHSGFVPARLTEAFDPTGVAAALGAMPAEARQTALFFLGDGGAQAWTILTYAFVHAGWPHLLANSIWLIAFGSPVAVRLGGMKFLTLFLVAAIGGALAHWLTYPFGFEPVVGASAGISGVMAAAARFVFQPGGPVGPPPLDPEAPPAPALSVLECFRDRRALAFIAIWFLVNLVVGIAAGPLGVSAAPIAWQAHIGGFVVGLVFFSALDPGPPERSADALGADELNEPTDSI